MVENFVQFKCLAPQRDNKLQEKLVEQFTTSTRVFKMLGPLSRIVLQKCPPPSKLSLDLSRWIVFLAFNLARRRRRFSAARPVEPENL